MDTHTKAAFINLEELAWSSFLTVSGGGGSLSSYAVSPFLWTVFFKVDLFSIPDGKCFFTPGDHGNLGVWDVPPGAVISIPESLGTFHTGLTPIQFGTLVIPPTVGVAVILMRDGGHVTADGIAAGHEALNLGVQGVITQLTQQAVAQQMPVTDQQIDSAVASAKLPEKVSKAVQDAQSFCENVWAASGADSEIGHVVFTWSLAKFSGTSMTQSETKAIVESQWSKWSVKASITVTDPCPATASGRALDKVFLGAASGQPKRKRKQELRRKPDLDLLLGLMREFRDKKKVLAETTFNEWWGFLKGHAPELAYRLASNPDAQTKARPLIDSLTEHLQDDELRISSQLVKHCTEFLEILQQNASSSLRHDLRAAAVVTRRLKNRTLHEALRMLAEPTVPPAPERIRKG